MDVLGAVALAAAIVVAAFWAVSTALVTAGIIRNRRRHRRGDAYIAWLAEPGRTFERLELEVYAEALAGNDAEGATDAES